MERPHKRNTGLDVVGRALEPLSTRHEVNQGSGIHVVGEVGLSMAVRMYTPVAG